MTKLIINSDDFGYSKAINRGIIETFENGILTSTTMMANMPGFDDSVKLSQEFPELGIGVHLALTCGNPVLESSSELVDCEGNFLSLSYYKANKGNIDLDAVYEEWDAQIRKIRNAGVNISHLDSHHYIHSYGLLYQVIQKLAEKYAIPVRNCFGVDKKINNSKIVPMDDLWNIFNYPEIKDMSKPYEEIKGQIFEVFSRDAKKYAKNKRIEAVVHPGYLDSMIWYGSNFNLARLREVDVLCDMDFHELLLDYGYELTNYHSY